MRRIATSLCLLLALTVLAGAASVKGEANYEPYRKIVLKAKDVTNAKASFLWDVTPDADTVEDGGTLYVWAPPGRYRVTLTAIDFENKKVERASFTFTVGGQPGPDPGPGPQPDPTPAPNADLIKMIGTAQARDTDADKAGLARKLGAIYRVAAGSTVDDAGLKTAGDLDAVVRATAQKEIGLLTIPETRAAAGAWLAARLPTARTAVLDSETRKKFKVEYLALASVLEGAKGRVKK